MGVLFPVALVCSQRMPADVRDWGADRVGEGSEQMVSGIHRDLGGGREWG